MAIFINYKEIPIRENQYNPCISAFYEQNSTFKIEDGFARTRRIHTDVLKNHPRKFAKKIHYPSPLVFTYIFFH